jgi:hypothetical protein
MNPSEAAFGGLILYNKGKRTFDLWDPVVLPLSLPDYIRLSAVGKATIRSGRVFLLREDGRVRTSMLDAKNTPRSGTGEGPYRARNRKTPKELTLFDK